MPLSDIPNIDYYMESKGEKGENDETKIGKEEGTEHIQGEKNNKDSVDDPNLDKSYGKTIIFELPTLLEELNSCVLKLPMKFVLYLTIPYFESRIE